MILISYGLGIALCGLGVFRALAAFRLFGSEMREGDQSAASSILGRGLLSAVGVALIGVQIILLASTQLREPVLWPAITGLICLVVASIWSAASRRTRSSP